MPNPIIAASSYSNSAPLIWSFWHGSQRNKTNLTVDAAPSKCAEMLSEKKVAVALTPVIEYQRIADTVIVPGCCVGSKQAVKSVVLVTKGGELKSAKTVALDKSSKTSVALTQIIFKEFFGRTPEFVPHEPDIKAMLAKHDAALLIGDPALSLDAAEYRVFDIAETWRSFTGCGFVFAFWLVREDFADAARNIDFIAARDEGLAKVEEIINYYSPAVPLSRPDFRRYLQENITYQLDDDLRTGLNLYYRFARKHDLIGESKPLKFL